MRNGGGVLCHPWIALKAYDFCLAHQAPGSALCRPCLCSFVLLTIAGWMTRDHQRVTEYLLAENAVLREQLRGRRIIYTDGQRRRLATAAKKLGRKALRQLDTLATPLRQPGRVAGNGRPFCFAAVRPFPCVGSRE
jgi:hypothetical protein